MIHATNSRERDSREPDGKVTRSVDLQFMIIAFSLSLLLVGCRKADQGGLSNTGNSGRNDAPVAIDPDPPVVYPSALYQQGLVPESTQVAGSSGYTEFDSAAVAGVPKMHFAPAQHDGRPIATAFTQPVHFRRAQGGEKKP